MISIKRENIIYMLLSILALVYVLYRAIRLEITYDEAWTLKSFVPLSWMHILNYTPTDANNHILNTLLIKFFLFIGPDYTFFARLPSILGFVSYLLFSYKISKFLPQPAGLTLFILLIINPFLMDFFSLARGYGLGLGFQMASIYYLLSFIKNRRLRSVIYLLLFASLGVLSNFSELNFWIAILLTLLYNAFFVHKENQLKLSAYTFTITLCFVLIIYEPIRKLVKSGSLYYGGNTGFYSDTLISLTKYTQYSSVANEYTPIVLNIFLLLVTAGILILFIKNLRKGPSNLAIENALFILSFFAVITSILQHYLLGTLYLIDRTALFYYPLFILLLCFTFNFAAKAVQRIIFSVVVFFFGYNFLLNANTFKTALWYFDSRTQEILSWLDDKGVSQNKKVTLDFSWPLQSAIYHYKEKNRYPFVSVVNDVVNCKEAMNPDADYYIYLNRSLEKVGYEAEKQKILDFKRDTVLSYPKEGIYIFANIK